jgi:hypothetical protein
MAAAPSTGGSLAQQACAANEVIIGYVGTVDAPDAAANYLRTFQAICGTLAVSGTTTFTVQTTTAETLAQVGDGPVGTMTQTRRCPTNQVIVGFTGHSGGYIDQLSFICAPLQIGGTSPNFTLSNGASTTINFIGGPSGNAFAPINCPANQVAVGHAPRAGAFIDSFALVCAAPRLVVQ